MTQTEFQQSVITDLRRDLYLGRLQVNIDEARENVAAEYARERVRPTVASTRLMLAHNDLHRAMAKQLAVEQGLVL